MNRILLTIVAALSLLWLPGCGEEGEEIKAVWADYEAASTAGNADAIIAMCDPRNIERFDRLVEMAKYADRTAIERLEPMDRLYVLSLRYEKKPEELKSMTGLAMARQIYSEPDDPMFASVKVELGKVTMRMPRAFAELTVDGEKTPFRVEFVKTNDKWLIDLEGEDRMLASLLDKFAKMTNTSMESLIQRVASGGRPQSGKVWDAPLKK